MAARRNIRGQRCIFTVREATKLIFEPGSDEEEDVVTAFGDDGEEYFDSGEEYAPADQEMAEVCVRLCSKFGFLPPIWSLIWISQHLLLLNMSA